MRAVRIVLWAAVATAAIAFAAIYFWQRPASAPAPAATSLGFGGPFTLVGDNGQTFSSSQLAGRPYAMFFGFTHCPDVCPTTLARLVRLRRQMGGDDAFRIVFVTVDPERDGPAEVGRYTGLFDAPVIGLTGSPAQIAQVKKQFGIYSEKAGAGDSYTVDHTATVLLFDRKGEFQSTISQEEGDAAALAKLQRLTKT